MNKQQELITRWDSFLAKIEERFYEALKQGKEAVLDSLDENGYDYYSSNRTLISIKMQIEETLIYKIDQTWSNQVKPLMEADDTNYTYTLEESIKGSNKKDDLHYRLDEWAFICDGLLSEKYYQYAIQLVNKDFRCSQCSSPIQIIENFFQSQYVSCTYCNAVNTFVPETKYVQIGWNVVKNIAAYYALDEWRILAVLERKNQDNNYEDYKKKYNTACQNYLTKYFEKKTALMPHTIETLEKDFATALGKMAI